MCNFRIHWWRLVVVVWVDKRKNGKMKGITMDRKLSVCVTATNQPPDDSRQHHIHATTQNTPLDKFSSFPCIISHACLHLLTCMPSLLYCIQTPVNGMCKNLSYNSCMVILWCILSWLAKTCMLILLLSTHQYETKTRTTLLPV
jgi:hypothetical protein